MVRYESSENSGDFVVVSRRKSGGFCCYSLEDNKTIFPQQRIRRRGAPLSFLGLYLSPQVVRRLKSVTHSQCDRPVVNFPDEDCRHLYTGIKLYCLVIGEKRCEQLAQSRHTAAHRLKVEPKAVTRGCFWFLNTPEISDKNLTSINH